MKLMKQGYTELDLSLSSVSAIFCRCYPCSLVIKTHCDAIIQLYCTTYQFLLTPTPTIYLEPEKCLSVHAQEETAGPTAIFLAEVILHCIFWYLTQKINETSTLFIFPTPVIFCLKSMKPEQNAVPNTQKACSDLKSFAFCSSRPPSLKYIMRKWLSHWSGVSTCSQDRWYGVSMPLYKFVHDHIYLSLSSKVSFQLFFSIF